MLSGTSFATLWVRPIARFEPRGVAMRYRNKPWAGGWLAVCLLGAGACLAAAQTEVRTQTTTTTTQVRRLTGVLGSTVQLEGGASYGKVQDVVVNDDGCIEYLVVAEADHFTLIPWPAARVNFEQRTVSVNVTR